MVEVEGLWKRWGRKTALRGVTARFPAGTVTGILGENGSGKSTLFRIVAGVTRSSQGRATVDGVPVSRQTRRVTAFLPEVDPYYGWMRVDEQLAYLSAFYPGWDAAKEKDLLAFMKLDPRARIGELSHGQRARLKLVAAFAWPSRLVVMDEPFNGIDPPSRLRILDTLVRELRVEEQTVLLSTHLVAEVEEMVEHVVYLRDGVVALEGHADDLRRDRGGSLSTIFEEVAS